MAGTDALWARVPLAAGLAVRRFARDQEVSISLAVRLLILTSPLLQPYLPTVDNRGEVPIVVQEDSPHG